MQQAWLAFAREGRPTAEGLPEWPGYEPARRATMLLDAECRVEHDPLARERTLWDDLV
jgi:para-nitrobenzyl esterase